MIRRPPRSNRTDTLFPYTTLFRSDLRRLRREKIGFIFQFHNLLPFLTSLENVAVVLEIAGAEPGEARRRAAALLDYLQVGNRAGAPPANLSGGEAPREIGRASSRERVCQSV